ncbi:MAG TPA: hypothetical protein VHB49_00335 [Bradyrhizobium sp.]|nr:hypothetical protein [Bradyrhizobium sp.]
MRPALNDILGGSAASVPAIPPPGRKLLTYFISVMAERLNLANRTIAVLQRWGRKHGSQSINRHTGESIPR